MQNMFVLMVGPFGTSSRTMAECLQDDSIPIGRGIPYREPGSTLPPGVLTAFPICVTGDMLQQNTNAGIMSHKGNLGCRSCYIHKVEKGNLDYDVLATGRFEEAHSREYETIRARVGHLAHKTQDTAFHVRGHNRNGAIFKPAFEFLDQFGGFPNDIMHAEIRLSKYFQLIVVEILTPSGTAAYASAWNDMDIPYGWGKPQNPISHRGSYVFCEHGRMAELNPLVLMKMFNVHGDEDFSRTRAAKKKSYFKAGFMKAIAKELGDDKDPIDALLETAYALAEVVYICHKEALTEEEARILPSLVLRVRES